MKEHLEVVFGQNIFKGKNQRPQRKALHWITHYDLLQPTPESPHFIQRFLAACFYFATSERSTWDFDCAPTGNFSDTNCTVEVLSGGTADILGMRWLSGEPECSWGGIHCDELSQIREIRAGKPNKTENPSSQA